MAFEDVNVYATEAEWRTFNALFEPGSVLTSVENFMYSDI